MDKERRRHARYHRADLELDVARPGIKGILQLSASSECLDFSLAGLQFGSTTKFKEGEYVIIDLRVYDVAVRELRAEVVSCVPKELEDQCMYCTSVRFCFEMKSMQRPSIKRALLQIEDKLRVATEYPA